MQPPCVKGGFVRPAGECVRSRVARDRGSPAVIGIRPLDRWLCVPAFRRVCPYQLGSSVKASRISVKPLIRVWTLKSAIPVTALIPAICFISVSVWQQWRSSFSPEPAGTHQTPAKIGIIKRRVRDHPTTARRVHEAAAAGINAHVIHVVRADPEEYEVAGAQFAQGNGMCCAVLSACRARDFQPHCLMRKDCQTAAIKALSIRTAKLVRRADEMHGDTGYHSALLVGRGRRTIRRARRAAARSNEHHHRNGDGGPQAHPLGAGMPDRRHGSSSFTQPTSRTSPVSRSAIVRACRSSVTTWLDSGRAR